MYSLEIKTSKGIKIITEPKETAVLNFSSRTIIKVIDQNEKHHLIGAYNVFQAVMINCLVRDAIAKHEKSVNIANIEEDLK